MPPARIVVIFDSTLLVPRPLENSVSSLTIGDLLLVQNQEQIGQLTTYSHAASRISNPLLAQNEGRV